MGTTTLSLEQPVQQLRMCGPSSWWPTALMCAAGFPAKKTHRHSHTLTTTLCTMPRSCSSCAAALSTTNTNHKQTQVLFSLVRLNVPDALVSGPKTAEEIAATMGPDTNVEWLERLLACAHTMGMLKKYKNKNYTVPLASECCCWWCWWCWWTAVVLAVVCGAGLEAVKKRWIVRFKAIC